MKYTEAFAHFGAILANPNNQTMALAKDGSIVMSLWAHSFDVRARTITDKTSRYHLHQWTKNMVEEAFRSKRKVRIVRPDFSGEFPAGSHSGLASNFDPLDHLVGEIVSFEPEDGGKFVVAYCKS